MTKLFFQPFEKIQPFRYQFSLNVNFLLFEISWFYFSVRVRVFFNFSYFFNFSLFLRFFNSRNERKYSGFVLIYGGPWAVVKLHDLVLFTWSTQTTLRIAREAIKATIRSNFDYGLGHEMKHFHTFQNHSNPSSLLYNFRLDLFWPLHVVNSGHF